MNKKGVIDQLSALVAPVVGFAVLIVVGFLILSTVKDRAEAIEFSDWCTRDGFSYNSTKDQCSNGSIHEAPNYSNAYNATGSIQTSLSTIPSWLPIIIIAVIGAIIIGLVRFFR